MILYAYGQKEVIFFYQIGRKWKGIFNPQGQTQNVPQSGICPEQGEITEINILQLKNTTNCVRYWQTIQYAKLNCFGS